MKKKERNIKKWNKHTCPSKNVCLYVRPVPPIGDKVQNPMASKSKNKRNRKEKSFSDYENMKSTQQLLHKQFSSSKT